MDIIDQLKKRVQSYQGKYQSPPKVKISKEFWEQHAHAVAELSGKGVEFAVDKNIHLKSTFLIN